MRHQARTVAQFKPATPAELGCYVLEAHYFTAVPPADAPDHSDYIRQILWVHPYYRPLWVVAWHRSPNDGLVRTIRHVIGYRPQTLIRNRRPLRNVLKPAHALYGVDWDGPIYRDDTIDGRSEDEMQRPGSLPRYDPIGAWTVQGVRESLWRQRNVNVEDEIREDEAAADTEKHQAFEKPARDLIYMKGHDRTNTTPEEKDEDGNVIGGGIKSTVPRAYVSHSLIQTGDAA